MLHFFGFVLWARDYWRVKDRHIPDFQFRVHVFVLTLLGSNRVWVGSEKVMSFISICEMKWTSCTTSLWFEGSRNELFFVSMGGILGT